jgi:hypothetical protein
MVRLMAAVLLLTVAGGVAADIFAPDRFPIGVWLQQPKHAQRYRALGVNVYVGLWQGPTSGQLATLKQAGMPVVCQQNEVALSDPDRDIILGWLQQDEPDNAQPLLGKVGLAQFGWGSPVPPAEMVERYRRMKAKDATRPVFLNLGKGVAWDAWKGRGNRTGHPEDYRDYVRAADIVSFDIYPAVDLDTSLAGRLEVVAKGVRRLVTWAGPEKRVWNVIGSSRVKNPAARVDPDQIRAQVWMSIISGSRGIIYFVHQFKPRFVEATWLAEPGLAAAMREINAQVQGLAAVINRPASDDISEWRLVGDAKPGPIEDKLAITSRRHGCWTYVFAASLVNRPVRLAMRLDKVRQGAALEVMHERRTIRLGQDGYIDDFLPYGVHLYRVPASGKCSSAVIASEARQSRRTAFSSQRSATKLDRHVPPRCAGG